MTVAIPADIPNATAERFADFHLSLPGITLDYSRQRADAGVMEYLMGLARDMDVAGWRDRMFAGEAINTTEKRAVLHTACRTPYGDGSAPHADFIRDTLTRMEEFVTSVHSGAWRGHTGKPLTTIVNIGIGGSALGPEMAVLALKPHHKPDLRIHFVSNVDGADLWGVLQNCDPETTLFLIASKTFTTQETMLNATTARNWLVDALGDADCVQYHFAALSTNEAAVRDFGINPAMMFPFGEWVGGRYSLWSSIGLVVALAVGFDKFRALLDGAHAMDTHFRTAPLNRNMPVLMALLGYWNRSVLGHAALAVLPYDQRLRRFPAWLQQTDMESNGKSVRRDGTPVTQPTAPVIFGEPGTDCQHSFFQMVHQGTDIIPCDFIGALHPDHPLAGHHTVLLANMLAQADSLARGRSLAESGNDPHRSFAGGRPSNIILLDRLDPFNLGQLVALYEHRIFVQGILWGINSFDQFGVELGKILANKTLETLRADTPATGLAEMIRAGLQGGDAIPL